MQKRTFTTIFSLFAILLMVLPFLVSFNELLTKIVEKNLLYRWIQTTIVPIEARMLGAMLLPFGYTYALVAKGGILVNGVYLTITWNCLGWQSMLLFLATLLVGFAGKYTKRSIIEAIAIGIVGTFWLNILRMLFTILLAVHAPALFRVVFHDYLAAMTTVVWLFFFWWFSYRFVLEEKPA